MSATPGSRTSQFHESVIRDMTRLAMTHGAINLSQGYPDFDPPAEIVRAAHEAIDLGHNQYANPWGIPELRTRLAEMYGGRLGRTLDPEIHTTVTCGVTEAICSVMLAMLDPDDEVVIIDPAHDNFHPATRMAAGVPVAVPVHAPDFRLDIDRLRAAITPKTKALLLNTPHNPTGRVWDDDEIQALSDLVCEHDLYLICDEIYDRILYDGRVHVSPGSRPELRDRTVTIGGLGKSYAVTGWRLGYIVAPDSLAVAVRRTHDFLTICAPTPFQWAAVAALDLPESYFAQLTADYTERRSAMMAILETAGFSAAPPEGAYYVLADYTGLDIPQATLPSMEFAKWLTSEVGVAVVPGDSCYFSDEAGLGAGLVRFAFCKKLETLDAAAEAMRRGFADR